MTLRSGAVVAARHVWILAVEVRGGKAEVSRNNDRVWVQSSSLVSC